jgi:hypothetical protein
MWRFAAGQATGSAHEKLKTPCQDRFACVAMREEATLIAAMSDGAGSAPLAHIGAELAVTTLTSIVQFGVRAMRNDYEQVLRDGAALARKRVLEAAAERAVSPRDLACTLLAVIAAPVGGAALQIGDGVIVVRDLGSAWRWMFWPQKGEYANATYFLTDDAALSEAQVSQLPHEVQDVALTTDGLEGLALHYASRSAHEPFFRTAFASVHAAEGDGELSVLSAALSDFLRSPPVRTRTDDDTSLILATRRNRCT